MFGPAALAKLVAPFADPKVGGVTGELMLIEDDGHGIGEGVGLYWRYEKWIRRNESAIHSTLGATGAIYALRRSLQAAPAGDADRRRSRRCAPSGGIRVLFEPEARMRPRRDRRRDRMAAQGQDAGRQLSIVAQEPRLLVPGSIRLVAIRLAQDRPPRRAVRSSCCSSRAPRSQVRRRSTLPRSPDFWSSRRSPFPGGCRSVRVPRASPSRS